MKKFTQKYCIVSLLEEAKEGHIFSSNEWPLHTTIASPFSFDSGVKNLLKLFISISAKKIFKVRVKSEGYLGNGDKKVRVSLVDSSSELLDLHKNIIDLLLEHGAKFNNPGHNLDGFIAHATIQKSNHLNVNDVVEINNIVLIDMFPDQNADMRKIIKINKWSN